MGAGANENNKKIKKITSKDKYSGSVQANKNELSRNDNKSLVNNTNPNINNFPYRNYYQEQSIIKETEILPRETNVKNDLDNFMKKLIINDTLIKEGDSKDPPLLSLKNREKRELIEFFNSKLPNFKSDLINYNDKDVLNLNNNSREMLALIEQIINFEKGEQIYIDKMKNEIKKIEENPDKYKIDYITVMLVGKSGVGKSTLINKFLKLDKGNEAASGTGSFQTTEIKDYTSTNVPFLRLVDTRGIELNVDYGKEQILKHAKEFINKQLEAKISKDFVQCIWYCITGNRFENVEKQFLEELRNTYPDSKIPIILVYTQAVDMETVSEMSKYINDEKIDAKFIPVLAGAKKLMNNKSMEAYGLDVLLNETLTRCEDALSGDMRSLMTKQMKDDIVDILKKKNEKLKPVIYQKTVENFILNYKKFKKNEDFKKFIIDTFAYVIKDLFFVKNIKVNTENILKKRINNHFDNFIRIFNNKVDEIINPILKEKSNILLNFQVEEEKKYNRHIPISKKRNFDEFKATTEEFLKSNFYYIYQKYYMNFIINEICTQFTDSLVNKLNDKIEKELIEKDEIQRMINECFMQKYYELKSRISESQFNHDINNPSFFKPYFEYPSISEIGHSESNNNVNNSNFNYNGQINNVINLNDNNKINEIESRNDFEQNNQNMNIIEKENVEKEVCSEQKQNGNMNENNNQKLKEEHISELEENGNINQKDNENVEEEQFEYDEEY